MKYLDIPDWNVTLYNLSNQPVMDISELVNFSLRKRLNDSSILQFDIDLRQFEKKCKQINANPKNLLYPSRSEIKVSRNGIFQFGGIISRADSSYNQNEAKLKVTADSYIQYFSKRLLSKSYVATERSDIAWDAINTVQSIPNGNLGVTRGVSVETYKSDLTADYRDVKSIIQLYTYAQPKTYDFEITPNKVFNTYTRLGTDRPEVQLVYPQNIKTISIPRSSDTLYNRIVGFGSGIGDERIQTIIEDTSSQIQYRIQENKKVYSSVLNISTLQENVYGDLIQSLNVLELPEVTLAGGEIDLDVVDVGDSVYVRMDDSTFNSDAAGMLRICEMNISVSRERLEEVSIQFYNPEGNGALSNDL